jgi:hypothetical protein
VGPPSRRGAARSHRSRRATCTARASRRTGSPEVHLPPRQVLFHPLRRIGRYLCEQGRTLFLVTLRAKRLRIRSNLRWRYRSVIRLRPARGKAGESGERDRAGRRRTSVHDGSSSGLLGAPARRAPLRGRRSQQKGRLIPEYEPAPTGQGAACHWTRGRSPRGPHPPARGEEPARTGAPSGRHAGKAPAGMGIPAGGYWSARGRLPGKAPAAQGHGKMLLGEYRHAGTGQRARGQGDTRALAWGYRHADRTRPARRHWVGNARARGTGVIVWASEK